MLSWSGTTFCQVLIVHQELNRGFRKIVRGREFPGSSVSKEFACNAGDPGSIPGSGRSPEEMATYSSILAWRIPWTEETGGVQFMGSQKLDTA